MPVTVQGVRVTAIISAYNEADIIQQTVGDLAQQGIAVHVIDDGSTDGTVQALEPLLASGLVRIETLERKAAGSGGVREFPWSAVLARKQQLARELDADWFIHHDADEFGRPRGGISIFSKASGWWTGWATTRSTSRC